MACATAKPAMFCMQCEQTESGTGCTVVGVCGKDPTTAGLQDVLVHTLKGLGMYADACRKAGIATGETDTWILDTLFSTLTNVNFSPGALRAVCCARGCADRGGGVWWTWWWWRLSL